MVEGERCPHAIFVTCGGHTRSGKGNGASITPSSEVAERRVAPPVLLSGPDATSCRIQNRVTLGSASRSCLRERIQACEYFPQVPLDRALAQEQFPERSPVGVARTSKLWNLCSLGVSSAKTSTLRLDVRFPRWPVAPAGVFGETLNAHRHEHAVSGPELSTGTYPTAGSS